MNALRRLPLSRLLLLCTAVIAVGVSATALASNLISGPKPPPKPLAEAVHDALAAPPVSGVSARIQLTDHLIEASSLASQGGNGSSIASNPLLTGGSGRLWIGNNGKLRLELQSESGDTQVIYDGSKITIYDAASNSLYRIPAQLADSGQSSGSSDSPKSIPTIAEIQNTITKLMNHASVSGATPDDVAGQPAYTVRISPSSHGGLVGGAELSWDAIHGVPLRIAIYSSTSSTPVIELTATEITYGSVSDSTFDLTPPTGAKITEIEQPSDSGPHAGQSGPGHQAGSAPVTGVAAVQAALPFSLDAPAALAGITRSQVELVHLDGKPAALLTYGEGFDGLAVLETSSSKSSTAGSNPTQQSESESGSPSLPAELPKVTIGSSTATELPTALGTVLSFERTGVRYTLLGSVTPSVAESAARGL